MFVMRTYRQPHTAPSRTCCRGCTREAGEGTNLATTRHSQLLPAASVPLSRHQRVGVSDAVGCRARTRECRGREVLDTLAAQIEVTKAKRTWEVTPAPPGSSFHIG